MKQLHVLCHGSSCGLHLLMHGASRAQLLTDVQRGDRAEPQICEVDEEGEGWIRVHSIRMQGKAPFISLFPLDTQANVREISFEVHLCAHFRVSLMLPACILVEKMRGGTEVLLAAAMEN